MSQYRTIVIFTDLPRHIEYRIGDWPILQINDVIDVETSLKNPKDLSRVREVKGKYYVSRRILKYTTKDRNLDGLTQYLELSPAEKV